MRIVLVAGEEPGWGGIGTYTGVLGSALMGLGHEVQLVLRGWELEGIETLDGLTVHRVMVPEPSWRRGTEALVSRLYQTRESLAFSARAARVIARLRPDVVEMPEFHAPGLFAALRARLGDGRLGRASAPVIVRLHTPSYLDRALEGEPPNLDTRAVEALEALSARLAAGVSSPSAALASTVTERWRLPAARLRIVPNPIDEATFSPGGSEEGPTILVVGRVERHKGQDLLVEALPMVRAAVPDARLRIVGGDGGLSESLSRMAGVLGVSAALTLEGPRPREQLPELYRAAAVCVVPSRYENFPYTALEAMACGRAVIAARVGGLAEVVEDGRDGILVEPENPAALAEAITRLLRNAPERRRLAKAARERVLRSYTAAKVATRMVDHYSEVVR